MMKYSETGQQQQAAGHALLAGALPLLNRWIFVLVKAGADNVPPYTQEGREAIARDRGYGESFGHFLDHFLEALNGPEWAPGTYYPGGWFRALTAGGSDPAAAAPTPEALAGFFHDEMRVEPDGRWHIAEKWISGRVLRFFLANLHFDAALGRYVVRYPLADSVETRYLHHLSPPFRVERVEFGADGVTLHLNDGTAEPARLESLWLDPEEQLLAAVKAQGLPAVFEESARWSLLDRLEERGDGLVLPLAAGEAGLALERPTPFPPGSLGDES